MHATLNMPDELMQQVQAGSCEKSKTRAIPCLFAREQHLAILAANRHFAEIPEIAVVGQ